jgi:RHS repeat-associated protein
VSYTTQGVSTSGLIELRAQIGSVIGDIGTLNVTVPPSSDAAAVSPPGVLARGQCLTLALASASASECGDLRIVHPLPAVRTMNRVRTPTLVYNSAQAIGWVSLGTNVTVPAGSQAPITVSAQLKIGGVVRASGSWAGNQWSPGAVRRIALGFTGPSQSLATGVYDYVLEVTKLYAPDTCPKITTTGKLVIVDRSTSYFGAGWWLAGLEQWIKASSVWVGGDGSVRQYTLRAGTVYPNRVWGAPSVTYPDTIREIGGEFVRPLPDSVWVFFDTTTGRHIRTRNQQGHVTTFGYDGSGNLSTITLPPAASPLSYTVTYVSGKVSTIVAPGVPSSRTTTLTITGGRLTSILEPDTRTVSFGYGSDNKITSRTDRRSTVTDFQYDAGNRVSQATINLSPGTITRTMQQAASQGLAGTSVPITQVFTRLNGPRAENTTSFYLNGFAAPDSIVDALGQKTRLYRTSTTFPGLVAQMITVTALSTTATYDARGRMLTATAPSSSGQPATTTYVWDTKWDQVTKITNPEGDFMDFGVEAATGNRIWQQDGRGASTRTNFKYNPNNQVDTIVPPGTSPYRYGYDTKGNLAADTTALGMVTTRTNNAIGLTTQIQTPTGICCAGGWSPFQTETISYSIRNEDTLRVTSLSGQTTTVRSHYDAEGNRDSLSRSFTPLASGIVVPWVTSWQYDRANRPTRQTEPDQTSEQRTLDAAGNLQSVLTRRGLTITMTYDSLNRLVTRTVPAITFSGFPAPQITPATPVNQLPYNGYSWTVDNQTLQYAADGQVSRATNKDATVARSYAANGRMLAETLYIKDTPRTGNHVYVTSYSYDKNGQRTGVMAPSSFAGGMIGYAYSSQWGALTSVTDITGLAFGFTYNTRSELTGIAYGGGISQTLGYDADGRLSTDLIANGVNQAFPYYPGPTLRNFSVSVRNARGQILTSSDAVQADQVQATYSGLGYLLTSNLHQNLVNGVSGAPATYASGDVSTVDALGNLMTTTTKDSVGNGSGWSVTQKSGSNSYTTLGRLNTRVLSTASTVYSYDLSGNAYFEATTVSPNVTAERAAYDGAHEVLLATDTRASGQRTFEEYRYDALGRRVWVKSVKTCEPSSQGVDCNAPYVRRTIWDGSQELAEIQVPVDAGNPAVEEMDTGYPVVPWNFSQADPNPFYGRVVYGPGLSVDRPLTVTRYEYRDQPSSGSSTLTWPRFTWQIYWNYQGLPAYGTLTTGAWAYPYQLGQGQTSCPILGNQTTQRCVLVQWPLKHSAFDQNRGALIYPSWHGSLLEGKRNRSGLEYRRNRQYDPQAGRFTQEDPIGLAGGINLYGYAAGDPVNFSDPFGLCPLWMRLFTDACRKYDGLRPPERAVVDRIGVRRSRTALRIWNEANAEADRLYGPAEAQPLNSVHDAFRHGYGMCRLTQEGGFETAKAAGDAHEAIAGNPEPARTMDLANNARGRALGSNANTNCSQAVQQGIQSGDFWIAPGNQLQRSGGQP